MDEGWSLLADVLVLLGAALVLGTLAELLRQSAIVGYLLAGTLVGPNVLGLIGGGEPVEVIAELGVALLLFTIGLEFSFTRLRRLGNVALVGGSLQVLLTGLAVWGAAQLVGLPPTAAAAVGCMVALSSTATVLRLLADRAALESPYGRNATGILLLQDVAVLPLTLLVSALATQGTPLQVLGTLGKTLLYGAALVAAMLVLFNLVVPRLLNLRQWSRNREFPILLAIVLALGSAAAAHEAKISPAIGAFLAGVLLAGSPFAAQVRADVASLRTVLVTLFFASVGMLADPAWAAANLHLVAGASLAVLVGKSAVVLGVLSLPARSIRVPAGIALGTGLCIAQVGEFSFVLAKIARGSLIDEDTFRLIVSVTVVTLLLTPYLVRLAPRAAGWFEGRFRRGAGTQPASDEPAGERPRLLIVGFGPAGQRVAGDLLRRLRGRISVIDLNPQAAGVAQEYGLGVHLGDASQAEILEHAGIGGRRGGWFVTLPDPEAVRRVIQLCRSLRPNLTIIARARYHAHRWDLTIAGAETVVDEEDHVGHRLAAEARRVLGGDEG